MPNGSDTLRLERTTLPLADFQRALTRLADALGQPESELIPAPGVDSVARSSDVHRERHRGSRTPRGQLQTAVPGVWPGSTRGDRSPPATPPVRSHPGYVVMSSLTDPPAIPAPPPCPATRVSPHRVARRRHPSLTRCGSCPTDTTHADSPLRADFPRAHPRPASFNAHRRCIRAAV